MSDQRERGLERVAACGDPTAARRLRLLRCRRGEHRWEELAVPRLAMRCRYCETVQTVEEWLQGQLRAEAVRRFGEEALTSTWERVKVQVPGRPWELLCRCNKPDRAPVLRVGEPCSVLDTEAAHVVLDPVTFGRVNSEGTVRVAWDCTLGRCRECGKVFVSASAASSSRLPWA